MYIASCPLRVSLFGGSTDNPLFVEKYGYGSVISFACDLKTYVTISQDKFGLNKHDHKYIINYSQREEVVNIDDIQNEVVKVVLKYFDMPPVQVTLTSDAYSQGSGLASSSSYIISLIKACCMFHGIEKTDTQICFLAYILELKINPYCGYQDPYGCGVGGFKRIEFYDINTIRYEYLPTNIFNHYDTHLVFTGVTRNSKKILKDVSENLDRVRPILKITDTAYSLLKENNYPQVLHQLNKGWCKKKKTSSSISSNQRIQEMDKVLEECESVVAHKLCGAGNGGFFLTFSHKGSLSIPYDCVKIKIVSEGVRGESF
jgi:D-glycero-alpha-D-manno-heptose-7-phosphate kinase